MFNKGNTRKHSFLTLKISQNNLFLYGVIRDLIKIDPVFQTPRENSKFITGSSNTGRVVVVYNPINPQGPKVINIFLFYIQEIESFLIRIE